MISLSKSYHLGHDSVIIAYDALLGSLDSTKPWDELLLRGALHGTSIIIIIIVPIIIIIIIIIMKFVFLFALSIQINSLIIIL